MHAGSARRAAAGPVRWLHHLGEHALAFHHSPVVHHQQQLAQEEHAARTMVLPAGAPAGVLIRNPWPVLAILCLGFFMILLDTTIVNIAVPSIITSLGASLDQILWVLNAYILVYAALLIPAGRLGELYGQRTLFLIGIVIFVLASAGCGFAQSTQQLLAARAAQGLGGALLTPQTLALLTEVFPPRSRGVALGVWGATAGVAAAAGPLLGGLIVSDLGWRWIFYVNLPIGALAIAGALALVPDLKPARDHDIDLVGVLLAAAGMTLLVYGLIEGHRFNWGAFWGPLTIVEMLVAGGLLVVAFILWERLHPQPLIPTLLFLDRNFAVASVVGALVGFALLAFFFVFALYLQSARGMSALQAGLLISPLPLASMFTAPVAGHLSDRIGGKPILILGLLLFGVGFAGEGLLAGPDSPALTMVPAMVVTGAGLGMTFAPLTALALEGIRPATAGVAAGVLNTTRQVGSVLGGAVIGAMLQIQLASRLHEEALARTSALPPEVRDRVLQLYSGTGAVSMGGSAGSATAGAAPEVASQVTAAVQAIFSHGFVEAMRAPMLTGAGVLFAAAVISLAFRRGRVPAGDQPEAVRTATS